MEAASQRARKRREQLGLTQRRVAEACKVSQQAYEKFESGNTKRPRYIYELAKVLKTSASWLLTGEADESVGAYQAVESHALAVTNSAGGGRIPLYSYFINSKAKKLTSFENSEVIDRVDPLPGLENTTGAIALYVQGDDLDRVYPHGTVLYLDRNRYPSKNKPCVCIGLEGIRILIYTGSSKGCYHFRLMESGKEKRVKISEVKALYRIVGALYG